MEAIETRVLQAKENAAEMERLILEFEPFILRCAAKTSRRYLSNSDDEWSIALSAFLQAVEQYRPERGNFYSFAELVIHRRLADYFRSQAKHQPEILTAPEVFESGPLEESPQPALQAALAEKLAVTEPQNDLRYEIEEINKVFSRYGFSFFDLADCSPKAEKTRAACAKAAAFVLSSSILQCELKENRLLPIKQIEKNTGVPRKILERHRKYLIAAVEILSGEYPGLAHYMRFIRKEQSR